MTETNPIALAILASRPGYGVSLSFGRDGGWHSYSQLASEEAARAVERAFGKAPPRTHEEARAAGRYTAHVDFVQELVRTGRRTDRTGYLKRLEVQRTASGMANSKRPDMETTLLWDPIRRYTDGKADHTPNVGWYLEPKVEWFGDGTVILSCEAVDRDGALVDLYVIRGCDHDYAHRSGGNCYHIHTCKLCGHRYDIDSGD